MYVLYGGRISRAVGPQMVLEEAGLAYELREVDIVPSTGASDRRTRWRPAHSDDFRPPAARAR